MINSLIKIFIIKLKFRKKIKINITKGVSFGSIFQIKNGNISFGRGLGIKKGSKLAANGGNLIIGKGVNFNHNCMCISHKLIKIGDECSFGPNVCIYDHDHDFGISGKIKGKFKSSEIIIGNNVWIGANTVILRGTNIGDNTIIGAGCVIKGRIPQNSIITQDRNINIRTLRNN